MLKKNLKRDDRKGGKEQDRWLGPYEVREITPRGLYRLSKNGRDLKQNVNRTNIKVYLE